MKWNFRLAVSWNVLRPKRTFHLLNGNFVMGEQNSLPLLLLYFKRPRIPRSPPRGTYLLNSPPVKPSCRQATVASYRDQPWSQMVPTSSSMIISRRPVLWVPPTRRSCGSRQRQESSYTKRWHIFIIILYRELKYTCIWKFCLFCFYMSWLVE